MRDAASDRGGGVRIGLEFGNDPPGAPRIPAAWHVRGLAWDRERRRLYFTDSAGVEVAELGA